MGGMIFIIINEVVSIFRRFESFLELGPSGPVKSDRYFKISGNELIVLLKADITFGHLD